MSVFSNGCLKSIQSLQRQALALVSAINLCPRRLEGILQMFQNSNCVPCELNRRGGGQGRVKPRCPTPDKTTATATKALQLNFCLVLLLTRLYLLSNRLSPISQLLSDSSLLMKGHRIVRHSQ